MGNKINTEALNNIGYGLYVITTNTDNRDNGCIINTVMQITSKPLQIAVCLNKLNKTNEMIKKSKKFNLSILNQDAQFDIFKHFGFQSGKNIDKFEGYKSAKRAENGILYISEYTNSYLSAKVVNEVEFDTHTMFIGEVTDAECLNNSPSVTYAFYHKNIKPKAQKNDKKGWRCKICGYIYEGEELPADFICPLCKHGIEDFERI